MQQIVHEQRVRKLGNNPLTKGIIAYWMSRDQRVIDNWALLFARELSLKYHAPLIVVFTFDPAYPGANLRHYDFMLKGLQLVEDQLSEKNIPFFIRAGEPAEEILKIVTELQIGCLITDFDPLRVKREWKKKVVSQLKVPFYEVDTHNIVPCWIASQKEEYGAYTLRPKIKKLLHEFLTSFPELCEQKNNPFKSVRTDWKSLTNSISNSDSVTPLTNNPGSHAALSLLNEFIHVKLPNYNAFKNDPTHDGLSGLSAYLHFGHISSQRIAQEVLEKFKDDENTVAFLEELIVRKELSDNFCHYNPNYDNLSGARKWAKQTLEEHKKDKREFIYSLEDFENAGTHDNLWNAAQNEMKKTGKMHGYLRMYWAKKILEWTIDPATALDIAIKLNDKYSLDGRDPNGYTGCLWSIAGIHDRPWAERPVFGKIRYMNYNGCKRKFDVDAYIRFINQIPT